MTRASAPPGLIIAAPRSGAGKTTITLGLMRALTARGLSVQPFKCGPDYIDPAFHAAATGRPSFNLDSWAMPAPMIRHLVVESGGDIAIAEGVMGLFDGAAGAGRSGRGATADIAALLGWPVILVLDISGQTETAAAIALGCQCYRQDMIVAGVILNRVASARHAALVQPAFDAIGIPIFGALPRHESLVLPERHLGLVQACEHQAIGGHLDRLAEAITASVDLDAVIAVARPGKSLLSNAGDVGAEPSVLPPPGQRIALASDRAFSFVYPHLLRAWRAAGAQIMPFSPLADEPPAADSDAVWLPGGYPELHAGTLAAAGRFRDGLHSLAARGAPIHGECGGYMVLGEGLEDFGRRPPQDGRAAFAGDQLCAAQAESRLSAGKAARLLRAGTAGRRDLRARVPLCHAPRRPRFPAGLLLRRRWWQDRGAGCPARLRHRDVFPRH